MILQLLLDKLTLHIVSKVQVIVCACTNTWTTKNISFGKQKVFLANQALAEWQMACPKSVIAPQVSVFKDVKKSL